MKIINDYPPNIDSIRKVFGTKALRYAVFTYGDTLYSPHKDIIIPAHLEAHELTHVKQQGDKPESWWKRYLVDPQFRLEQELEAYKAQYQYLTGHENRQQRRSILKKISKDLSGPLYGNIITTSEAKELITA